MHVQMRGQELMAVVATDCAARSAKQVTLQGGPVDVQRGMTRSSIPSMSQISAQFLPMLSPMMWTAVLL